ASASPPPGGSTRRRRPSSTPPAPARSGEGRRGVGGHAGAARVRMIGQIPTRRTRRERGGTQRKECALRAPHFLRVLCATSASSALKKRSGRRWLGQGS